MQGADPAQLVRPQSAKGAFSLLRRGDLAAAESACRSILDRTPDDAPATHLMGLVRHRQDRHDEAVALMRRSIELAPDTPDFPSNLAGVLGFLGRDEEATELLEQAVALAPGHPEARHNLGVNREKLGLLAEAIEAYRKAIALKPAYAGAWCHLGNALRKSGNPDEAEAAYRKALDLNPRDGEALSNLGACYHDRGQRKEALALLERAVACFPHDYDARWNHALAALQAGDLARGLAGYECRLRDPRKLHRRWAAPAWDGKADVAGKTVLLHAEQGLGDTIQFARYAPLVAARGARVLLSCQPALVSLLKTLAGVAEVIADAPGVAFPPHDYQVPLMSLPHRLGTIDMVELPAAVPYLRPDPARERCWGRRMEAVEGLRVGIAWQGNPRYSHDAIRSVPLRFFEPLAGIEGVRLVSLQKGHGREQMEGSPLVGAVVDWTAEMDEPGEGGGGGAFLDTAAVIAHLDLVITSDTAVAHLAGALGADVWLATCYAPDWRWLWDRPDSPWYPTMRLFRQKARGDWEGVFAEIADALRAEAARRLAPSVNSGGPGIAVPISPGELLDRMTILRLKLAHAADPAKRDPIGRELAALESTASTLGRSPRLDALTTELSAVNRRLWETEDALRACEAAADFGPRFVELARSVYRDNDQRSAVKARINRVLAHDGGEQKVHLIY